jgi:hypothetical protein
VVVTVVSAVVFDEVYAAVIVASMVAADAVVAVVAVVTVVAVVAVVAVVVVVVLVVDDAAAANDTS